MNRSYLFTAVVALIASSDPTLAQASSGIPVIRPKVTELGALRDTTPFQSLMPDEAALSPHGTLIAYNTRQDLRIWNVSSRTSRVVLNGWSESITWSPAGDAIAFAHDPDQGGPRQLWVLRVNPASGEPIGSPQRASLSAITGNAAQFSPDGKSIAFPRQDTGDHSSLVVIPTGGGTERVFASGYHIRKLRWTVDGSGIYYVSYQDSTMAKPMLSMVSVKSGTRTLVHDFTSQRTAPAVSADNRIASFFPDEADSETPMRVGDLAGRSLAALSIPFNVRIGDWSGQNRLAGVRETHTRGLRVVNIADGKSHLLIDSTADVQAAAWFADSRRVAAIVFYDTIGVLVTMNSDGSGMRKLPLVARPFQSVNVGHGFAQTLRVSPDGQYAVYQGAGHRSLELVNLSTGNQRTLARAAVIEPPVWRRDSRTIRYDRLDTFPSTDSKWRTVHDVSVDGTEKFVRAFLASQYPRAAWIISEDYASIFGEKNKTAIARFDGTPDQLLLRASTRRPGVVSPDGRIIALFPGPIASGESARRVILVSISDGSERTLNLPFAETACENFSPDGRYLYCTARDGTIGPQTLWEVPLDGAKPRVVANINSREFMGVSALSPDGKWSLNTAGDVRGAAFVSLDYADGMARLPASSPKSSSSSPTTRPRR